MYRRTLVVAMVMTLLGGFGLTAGPPEKGKRPAAELKLPSEIKLEKGVALKFCPESSAGTVVWINLNEDLSLIPHENGRCCYLVSCMPGTYKIVGVAVDEKGASVPQYVKVVVEGAKTPPITPPVPPLPPAPPAGKADPAGATGQLRVGNSGCTASVIYPRRADGKWDVLTASHCTSGPGTKGILTLKNGKMLALTVVGRYPGPDLTWFVTDQVHDDLPWVEIADENPGPGTAVYHIGYGVDRPQNREDGSVQESENPDGQSRFLLSVSSGDSGGPIFRSDNHKVVGTVCCTESKGSKVSMWACSARVIKLNRPGRATEDGWIPLPIPERSHRSKERAMRD